MEGQIGPYARERILLCSADAGPDSQKTTVDDAGHFFPGAKWVGAFRNIADRTRSQLVILTTGHGMVYPWDVIGPFDAHIDIYKEEIQKRWIQTIPPIIGGNQYDIMLFYSGGCPREPYLDLLLPILKDHGISLLTFGRPNMYDIDKTEHILDLIVAGNSLHKIRSVLAVPERLQFFPAKGPGMEATRPKVASADSISAGAFSETITAVQNALVDVISSSLFSYDEISAIKSTLKELKSGAVRIVPFFGIHELDESWLLDSDAFVYKESVEDISCFLSAETDFMDEDLEEDYEGSPTEEEMLSAPAFLRDEEEDLLEFDELSADAAEILPQGLKARWDIAMPDTFTKSIKGLDKKLQGRILEALGKIVKDPLKEIGDTIKPLSRDMKGLWRYRIGDYRLIYRPEVERNRVVLLCCGARGGVYE